MEVVVAEAAAAAVASVAEHLAVPAEVVAQRAADCSVAVSDAIQGARSVRSTASDRNPDR